MANTRDQYFRTEFAGKYIIPRLVKPMCIIIDLENYFCFLFGMIECTYFIIFLHRTYALMRVSTFQGH